MRIEEQIKAYTDQIDGTQLTVSADEALTRVDSIRVDGSHTYELPTHTRLHKLLGAGAIAAAVLILFGSTLWLTREIEPTADPAATVEPMPTAFTAQTVESEQRIDTPFGTWVWRQLDTPVHWVTEFNGMFYSVTTPKRFNDRGEPVHPEDLDAPRHLFFSTDGISWSQRPLPDEMSGLYLGMTERDGMLIMVGTQVDLQFVRAWSTEDGIIWTELPDGDEGELPLFNRLGLTVPGITAVGAVLQVQHFDPVQVGNVQLVHGSVSFRFPDKVTNAMQQRTRGYESVTTNADEVRILIWSLESEEFTEPDHADADIEAVIVMERAPDGALSIDYTFWNGLESAGDLLHTARIEIDAALSVDPISPDASLHPWFHLLWRSEGVGEFEVVPTPIERIPEPEAHQSPRIGHIASIDGQFVLYGGAPGGPTTRVNEFVTRAEPSRIATIATSNDGLEWEVTQIDDLVNPQHVAVADSAPTIWNGEFVDWISDDGLTGEVIERRSDDWITHGPAGTFMTFDGSHLRLSRDAKTWVSLPLPEGSNSHGYAVGMVESRFFYSSGNDEFNWVGYLDP